MERPTKIKVEKVKAYLVNVSVGDPIPIDEDELPKVIGAYQKGIGAVVRQGFINPSYLVSITSDNKRIARFYEDTKYRLEIRNQGLQKLEDVMNTSKLAKQIQLQAKEVAQIGQG